jgi:type II secretory pathway component PulF
MIVPIFIFLVGGAAALAVLATFLVLQTRRRRQDSLLSLLTVSVERGIPLAPAVEAFAREYGSRTRWRAEQLAGLLRAGWSLPDALHAVGGLVPANAQLLIDVGHETGTLGPALRYAMESRGPYVAFWVQLGSRLAYLGALLFFALMILSFMMLKIVPAFQKIFDDFGTELPALTMLVINAASIAGNWIAVLLGLICFVLVPLLILWGCGVLPFSLPLVDRLMRRLYVSTLLEALSLVVGKQRPVEETIGALARWCRRRPVRRRLEEVGADLAQGANWCESFAARGLIGKTDLIVLKSAQQVGNLSWALRELAESGRRRVAYRLSALLQLAYPLVILSLGLLAMIYAVGFFMPLVSLIQRLT